MQKLRLASRGAQQARKTSIARKTRIQKEDFERREIKKAAEQNFAQFEVPRLRQLALERKARKQDWELGPLAPRHDAAIVDGDYGTLPATFFQHGRVHPKRRKIHSIYEGDRVVMLKGPRKGHIGVVKTIDDEREAAVITDFNKMYLKLDEWQREVSGTDKQFAEVEAYVKMDHVRVVYAYEDPKTGRMKDVIVEKFDRRPSGDPSTKNSDRYIAGTNILVPTPPESENDPEEDEKTEYEGDTEAMDVEEITYRLKLFTNPLPRGVIHELRNKYSRTRDQHSASQKEEILEQEAKRKEEMKEDLVINPEHRTPPMMRTPLEEFRLQQRKEKAAEPTPVNTNLLQRMGELLAQRR